MILRVALKRKSLAKNRQSFLFNVKSCQMDEDKADFDLSSWVEVSISPIPI